MIRLAVKEDARMIYAIERQCFVYHTWTLAMFEDALANPLYTFYLFETKGEAAGFSCVKVTDCEAEIDYIAVLKKFRKRGTGAQLLNASLAAAREKKAQAVFLEVGVQNIPAINLYEKYGFTKISTRQNYYGEGKDAHVLKMEIL